MTDPSNDRDRDEDGLSQEASDDADAPDAVQDDDADDESGSSDSEASAEGRPAATGEPARSGNPARAAAADEKPKTRPVKPKRVGNRWAAPAMLTSAGIGLLWIVLYYVFANTDNPIPLMSDLGDWNLIVGMGFIVAAFGFSMKWE